MIGRVEPDYDVGDEVVYIGPYCAGGAGPYFCSGIASEPDGVCEEHGLFGCLPVFVTSAVLGADYDNWCPTSWKKAPKRREIEQERAVKRTRQREDA